MIRDAPRHAATETGLVPYSVPVQVRLTGPARSPEEDTGRVDDTRDAYLNEVLIGGREHVAITIVDYDQQWPQRFEDTAERVRQVLGGKALSVEHIGSVKPTRRQPAILLAVLVVWTGVWSRGRRPRRMAA